MIGVVGSELIVQWKDEVLAHSCFPAGPPNDQRHLLSNGCSPTRVRSVLELCFILDVELKSINGSIETLNPNPLASVIHVLTN